MPPENELKARVDFTYSEDPFESDPVTILAKIGKKLNGKVGRLRRKTQGHGTSGRPDRVAQRSPEVKLQKIYARVQQIRNTSYEVRKTEQEEKRSRRKRRRQQRGGDLEAGYSDGFAFDLALPGPRREPPGLRLMACWRFRPPQLFF